MISNIYKNEIPCVRKFAPENPYFSLNNFCKQKFGEKIARIPLTLHNPCPNRINGKTGCIFCLPEAYEPPEELSSGTITEQINKRINQRGSFYKANKYIAYLQSGSNTAGNPAELKKAYTEALNHKDIVALSISTRPDCFADEIINIISNLTKENEIWVELGVQTAHNKTLDFLNRGHDNAASLSAIKKLKSAGVQHIVAHIILGLPGETENQMKKSIKIFSDAGIDGFKIHHLQIIKNTPLEKMWLNGEIKLYNFDEYLNLIVNIVETIPRDKVIHRLFGSSNNEYLIAPKWEISKPKIFSAILNEFKKRNTFQGNR
ncbi:MAG: TIGR01212 family radical SAM protein [Chlamydiae bacterium]|nr:MAG: TIGR01212 family radical SAM protein [Chlamydiota bacterium]